MGTPGDSAQRGWGGASLFTAITADTGTELGLAQPHGPSPLPLGTAVSCFTLKWALLFILYPLWKETVTLHTLMEILLVV